jgi:predicted amidohydrolase
MKEEVRAALVQLDPSPLDAAANRERITDAIAAVARSEEADLVVLPELANAGYVRERDRDFGREYWAQAEQLDGPTDKAIRQVIGRRPMLVAIGLAERHPSIAGVLYNTVSLIGRDGFLAYHRKAHLAGEEKHYFAAGRQIRATDTPIGVVGLAVCYDIYFPELCRSYALQGAHIVVAPFNTGARYEPEDTIAVVARARALENKIFVAAANRVGTQDGTDFCGGSLIAAPDGDTVLKLDREEQTGVGVMRSSILYRERAYHPTLTDRRPELYASLQQEV